MVGYYHLAHATWPGAWWQVKLETHSLLPRKGVIYAVKGAMTSSCCVGHCSICFVIWPVHLYNLQNTQKSKQVDPKMPDWPKKNISPDQQDVTHSLSAVDCTLYTMSGI